MRNLLIIVLLCLVGGAACEHKIKENKKPPDTGVISARFIPMVHDTVVKKEPPLRYFMCHYRFESDDVASFGTSFYVDTQFVSIGKWCKVIAKLTGNKEGKNHYMQIEFLYEFKNA